MVIIFKLEAPLQSWGVQPNIEYRDTAAFPSKSGVVGLIACAMGLTRDDPKIPELCSSLKMGVRADRPGDTIIDYHIARGFIQADGKMPNGGANSIITHRQYIQDAVFTVALEGDEDLLDEIIDAFHSPYWTPYLGRKSCPLSAPVMPVKKDQTIDEALKDITTLSERAADEIWCEVESEFGIAKNDQIFPRINASRPRYGKRYVKTYKIEKEADNETLDS